MPLDKAPEGATDKPLGLALNIGSGKVPLPPILSSFTEERLDLNPLVYPDHCLDARLVDGTPSFKEKYDLVYLSHVLEHFNLEDGRKVLKGALWSLRNGGFSLIRVPSIEIATQVMLDHREALDDPIRGYSADSGQTVTYRMLIDGVDTADKYMIHKQHYTLPSLKDTAEEVGFGETFGSYVTEVYEMILIAAKGVLDPEYKKLLDIKDKPVV